MWVDNPLSLAGGREIYGYNKNLGLIDLPDKGGLGDLKLQAYGGDFGGGHQAGWHPLMEVAVNGNGGPRRGDDEWTDLDGVLGMVREVLNANGNGNGSRVLSLPDLELPDEVFDEILERAGPSQIFLKQFRSVSDGVIASQQQITDGRVTLKRIAVRPLVGDFQVTLHQLGSHPVIEELGVQSQTTHLAFEVDMDFVLNDGRVLWQGPVS
jgi:hypothetical protein